MKPNEIMIGDWVRRRYITKPSGQEVVRDFRVDQIRRLFKDDEPDVWGDNGNMGTAEQMEPIPLTPEILEKNGWENSAPGVWQKEYGGFIFYWEEGTGRFGMDDFRYLQEQWKIHLQIKHTHELQHALRLCGIEKEVVL